jgi:hypothetical protein
MGWTADKQWRGDGDSACGDRSTDWAFDGKRRDKLTSGSSNDYGSYTHSGDVIGSLCCVVFFFFVFLQFL